MIPKINITNKHTINPFIILGNNSKRDPTIIRKLSFFEITLSVLIALRHLSTFKDLKKLL